MGWNGGPHGFVSPKISLIVSFFRLFAYSCLPLGTLVFALSMTRMVYFGAHFLASMLVYLVCVNDVPARLLMLMCFCKPASEEKLKNLHVLASDSDDARNLAEAILHRVVPCCAVMSERVIESKLTF